MAIWKDPTAAKKDVASFPVDAVSAPPRETMSEPATFAPAPVRESAPVSSFEPRPATPALKESIIASDLTIEGKIEGAGHVRIAGRFKGDVSVKGDLTLDNGAKLNGSVRAEKVVVAGELDGNVLQAARVELQPSAVMNGDIKAETLTIAAGSRVRGHIECGWEGQAGGKNAGNDKKQEDAKTA